MKKHLVVFDFGHGGDDSGAIGVHGEQEKDIVFSLKSRILKEAKRQGAFKAWFTRTGDKTVSLKDRVEVANSREAKLFVSLHCNWFNKPSAKGIETFHYKYSKRSEMIAEIFQTFLMTASPTHVDRGSKGGNFYVLRETDMPAVLLELGFMSNPHDMYAMHSDEWLDVIAKVIVEATLYSLNNLQTEAEETPLPRYQPDASTESWTSAFDTVLEAQSYQPSTRSAPSGWRRWLGRIAEVVFLEWVRSRTF